MNMIEKVAINTRKQKFIRTGRLGCWNEDEPLMAYELADAKAAIEALLEPTQDMIDAVGAISIELEGNIPHRIAYEAYIKTALGD